MSSRHHPKALPFLFLTEMWERFGFYTVQGLLILYMTHALGLPDDRSYIISGVFTALAYISPMAGGFIADRLLGFRTSIFWGGLLLSAGYALLAVPWTGGFYTALAIIIAGNGLFKPNISSLLGTLYTADNASRDAGFTLFYVGINLGALLASISSGLVQHYFGWHASFGLASAGLIFGIGIFATGISTGRIHEQPCVHPAIRHALLCKPLLLVYLLAVIALCVFLLQNHFAGKWLLPLAGIFLLIFLLRETLRQTPAQRNRMLVLIFMLLAAIIYWALFLQIFFSANLFIDRLVNRQSGHFVIPTTWFYGLESIFVILLGPIFAWGWQLLEQNSRSGSPITKALLGIVFAGLGFAVLAFSTLFANHAGLVSPLWIVLSYLLITIGEMLLSPIGLSTVTQLAPQHLVGMMMGIWLAALGFGGQFAGSLATLASMPEKNASLMTQLVCYRHAFTTFAGIAIGTALILLLLQKSLRVDTLHYNN